MKSNHFRTASNDASERPPSTEPDSYDHDTNIDDSYGIAVICSVAIDGQRQEFEDSTTPQTWRRTLKGLGTSGTSSTSTQPSTLEVTVAYKMEHLKNSESPWDLFMIPWNKMRVGEFLRESQEQTDHPLRIFVPAPSRDSPERLQGDWTAPIGTLDQASPSQRLGSPLNHLEFTARRNLEHILSVCAIQVTLPTHDIADSSVKMTLANVAAVALTCGDVSGHRICWSASL